MEVTNLRAETPGGGTMKMKTMRMSYGERRSKNYQSVEAHLEVECELEDGDDPGAVYGELKRKVTKAVQGITATQLKQLTSGKPVA
jgi:hypothetical protein